MAGGRDRSASHAWAAPDRGRARTTDVRIDRTIERFHVVRKEYHFPVHSYVGRPTSDLRCRDRCCLLANPHSTVQVVMAHIRTTGHCRTYAELDNWKVAASARTR